MLEKSVVIMLSKKTWLECVKDGRQLHSYPHDLCSLIKLECNLRKY
jgi:hypothetical protein